MQAVTGRSWCYGDHVSTDQIAPGRYLKLTNQEMAAHVMEGIDPTFATQVGPGDFVVAGVNFGCGSSRESAPAGLKYAGVGAVVAKSFARIFFRNAINVGLPVVVCPQADEIQPRQQLSLHLEEGVLKNLTTGKTYEVTPLPSHIMAILHAGGMVPWLERELLSRKA
ncbi:MAG: leuD 1 [Firmicutes bacterium]|nr:leuD 1 [Bacillota bacterium]